MNKHKQIAMIVACVVLFAPSKYVFASVDIGYERGLYIKTDDGKYKLKTNVQIQPQYQFLSIEGQGKTNTFQIRRARLIFSGNAFTKKLTYKFQFEAVGGRTSTTRESAGAARGPNLRDAYINYAFSDGIQLKAGQFKPYFNFEELTGSTKLQFVDRGLSNEAFSFNRDLGAAIHGKLLDKTLEYAVYVTNEGSNRNTVNPNNELLIGGRFVYAIAGENKYTQADVEWSEDPNIALGIAANYNRVATAPDNTIIGVTGDITARYRGFSVIGAGFYFRNHTLGQNTIGFLGQVGYFIIPEHFEIAGRFAGVIPKTAGAANGYEGGLALNYYAYGHRFKVQTDYNVLINSALVLGGAAAPGLVSGGALPGFIQDQVDHRVRTQMQLYF